MFVGSLALGVVFTLLTGLVNTTPGGGFVGATWYGFPDTWLRYLMVGPQYNPWVVDYTGLLVDIVLWTVVISFFLRAQCSCTGKKSKR